jgi:hypothetical protein
MSGENWESLITEKGFMRVPRALRLKRAELGITNNEYTILLDYVDYYSFSGTMNPYGHLTEVSGMNERSIRRVLTSLENKGLLKRKVNLHGNGRTKGVVFSIAPLVKKLKTMMKKMSPTVGEESVPYVGDISVPPNTGEEFNKRDESKNTSAKNADGRERAGDSVRVNEEGEKESEEGEMNYGFIRETGGSNQEAPRNDRSGGKAGQIHLARAGKGPRGLFAGEGEEGNLLNKIHPDPPLQRRELNAKDENVTIADSGGGVTDESYMSTDSVPPLQRRELNAKDEAAGIPLVTRNDRKRNKGEYSPSRWYNEVFRGLYEEAAGQPALTGGREYKSAETYFRRLRELNPDMEPGEVYELAGEGAAFMIASQLEGGVFGWMHKPPDICLLSSQAQSVEWHLRKMRRASGVRDGPGVTVTEEGGGTDVHINFIDKLREGQNANEQIERVYGELRGIESASRGRALPAGNRALRRKRG